jgi:pantetheine-phosphate adenylyltransferase
MLTQGWTHSSARVQWKLFIDGETGASPIQSEMAGRGRPALHRLHRPRIAIPACVRIQSSFLDPVVIRGPVKRIKAIYPGSFDPPTNGHLDLIERGSKIFDELVVAILRNPEKDPLFSVADRRKMLEAMTSGFDNVSVDTFDGLTVDYALRVEARAILRGIRAISDYEYELQMALMNRKLQPGLETVFMMPAEKYSYLSSRLVREVAQLGGSIECLVPDLVEQKLREKIDVAHKFANREQPAGSEGKGKFRKKKL